MQQKEGNKSAKVKVICCNDKVMKKRWSTVEKLMFKYEENMLLALAHAIHLLEQYSLAVFIPTTQYNAYIYLVF